MARSDGARWRAPEEEPWGAPQGATEAQTRVAPRPPLRLIEGEADAPAVRPRRLSHAAMAAIGGVAAIRVLTFAVGFAATYWLSARLGAAGIRPAAVRFTDHPVGFVLKAWRHWDAVWFLRVADHGYHIKSAAFFPLYPLAIRGLGRLVGNETLAGVLVSVVCFALAMVVLYRLVREETDEQAALWTVLFLSAASTSLFFQAVYSESLFLLLTLTAFWAGRHGRWWLAGAAGLLAALTRSAGVVLLAPLLWMWLEQRRGRPLRLPGGPRGARLLTARPARLPSLAWLLLVPAGVGLFMTYTLVRFNDPLLFMAAQHYWHRRLGLPTTALVQGALAAKRSVLRIAAEPSAFFTVARLPFHDQWLTVGNLLAFLAVLFAAALLVVCWRRLPAPYTVFAVVSLLLPMSYPTHTTPLLSMPRFVLVTFPLFIALGVLLARRLVLRWIVLAVMLAGLVVLTAMFTNGIWVA